MPLLLLLEALVLAFGCFCVVLIVSVSIFPAHFQLGFVCETFLVIGVFHLFFYLYVTFFYKPLDRGVKFGVDDVLPIRDSVLGM